MAIRPEDVEKTRERIARIEAYKAEIFELTEKLSDAHRWLLVELETEVEAQSSIMG